MLFEVDVQPLTSGPTRFIDGSGYESRAYSLVPRDLSTTVSWSHA